MYGDDLINEMRNKMSLSSLATGRSGNVDIGGIRYDKYGRPTEGSLAALNSLRDAELGMAGNDVERMRINDTYNGILQSLHGASPLQYRAKGGPVLPGQPYIVGEEGPELMIPSQQGQILPNPATQPLGFAMNAITPPQETLLQRPRIPERGRSLGYMTDGDTAQEMFRGPQGDYTAPISLADVSRRNWNVNPDDGMTLKDVEVAVGNARGTGDNLANVTSDGIRNRVEAINAGLQPGNTPEERMNFMNFRGTLQNSITNQERAQLEAAMKQVQEEGRYAREIAREDRRDARQERSLEASDARLNKTISAADSRLNKSIQAAMVRTARGDDNRDFRNESAMRKEFLTLPEVKEFPTITTNSKRAVSALNQQGSGSNVAVDQSIITVFNKMLDPASVVRESEYARTPQDLSVLSRIKGKWDKIQRGGAGLDANERAALGRMITNFNNIATEQYNAQVDYYTDLSKRYGYDPRNIVRLGGKRGENQGVGGAAQRQSGRDTTPAVKYLQGAKDKNDAKRRIGALLDKGWSAEEIAAAEGGVKWGW